MATSTDYDLSSCCCTSDVTVSCCDNALPTTLHATLTATNGCSCVSGTITLTWNSGTSKWTGTGAFGSCGRNITLSFYCIGSGASNFRLDVSFSDSCLTAFTATPIPTPACDPLNVAFSKTYPEAVCGCNTFKGSMAFRMTITA